MLNVAYGLAQRGDFVVIADWDLHAPGFSLNPLFYRPNLEPAPEHDTRQGVLDFLDSALNPANQTEILDPASLAQPTALGHQDRASGRLHRQGDIWCIPAGRFDPTANPHDYHAQLRRVQGRNLAQWLLEFKHQTTDQPISDPHALLDFFRQRIATIRHPETNQTPDWLLIDSRTGMTEIGDLLLHTDFIDRMVLVSGFNEQNLAGIETIIRSVQKNSAYGVLHTLLSLVFSPVPLGEEQLKQQRLDHIRDVLSQLARRDAHGTAELMPNLLTIPYHPRIALREEIMLRDFPQSDMVPAYEQVIAKVRADAAENYAAIEQSYRKAIQQDGRAAQPWYNLGNLLQYQLARYNEAEQAYREAIQRDTKDVAPWNNLGNLLTQHLHRYDEAEQAYRKAIQIDAQNAIPWNNLALLLQCQLARYNEAEQAYREAIQHDAKNAIPWNNLGNLLTQHLCQYSEAEQAYLEAIRRDAKLANPWCNLGNLLTYHLHRYDEAEQAYREAIQRDAKYAYPWNGLGNLLQDHLARYDEAERAYREAIQLDAQFALPWHGLGNLLQDHLARYDEAEQAYREAIQRDAKYAYPWNGLGHLLQYHLARYDEAEQAYREAIRLDAQFAYPWYNLGNLLFQHFQQYDAAAETFRQAAILEQQDPCSVYLALAELGLIAEQTAWVTEGLTKAQATLKTSEDRPIFALLTLGQALLTQEPNAVRAAHHALVAEQTTGEPATTGWNFADQAPFIARLPALERALYQAWVSIWDTQTATTDPSSTFAVWQRAQAAE